MPTAVLYGSVQCLCQNLGSSGPWARSNRMSQHRHRRCVNSEGTDRCGFCPKCADGRAGPLDRKPGGEDPRWRAAEAVFLTHHAGVVRHLTYLLGDRAAAEDVAQEVFVRFLRKPPREDGESGPWLRLVATRLAYNYLRAERRRRTREDGLYRDRALGPAQAASGPGEPDPGSATLRRALHQLTPRDQVTLLLRTAGHDYREIAMAIAVRPSSVGTILARATARLRAAYLAAGRNDQIEASAGLGKGGWRPHDALR